MGTVNWYLSLYENLFCIEKYEIIWPKIEDLEKFELNALPVYDDRYIKTKTRAFDDKVYINFCDLNVPHYAFKCDNNKINFIDLLLVCENNY